MKFSIIPRKKNQKDDNENLSEFIKSYKDNPKTRRKKKETSNAPVNKKNDDSLKESFKNFSKFRATLKQNVQHQTVNIKGFAHKIHTDKIIDKFKIVRRFKLSDYIIISLLCSILLFSTIFLVGPIILSNNFKRVAVEGGQVVEAMVGEPKNLNPLAATPVTEHPSNVTDSIVSLVYSSLLKINELGELEYDVLDSYETKENNTVYTLKLKDNIKFHDGDKLTSEDVKFTIDLIKDPAFNKSRTSLADWKDIEVNIIDDYTLDLKQKESSNTLKELLTFKIFPAHLWKDSDPTNFQSWAYNEKPRGSGPFKVKELEKNQLGEITSFILERNENYYNGKAKIETVKFVFYKDIDELLEKHKNDKKVNLGYFQDEIQRESPKGNENVLSTSRSFTLFFNMTKSSEWNTSSDIRKAIAYAINKEEIIDEVFYGNSKKIYSSIPSSSEYFNSKVTYPEYSPAKSRELLNKLGWKTNESSGFRMKDNNTLSLELKVRDNEMLVFIASKIKSQMEKIGILVDIKTLDKNAWDDQVKKNYDYESVLQITSLDSTMLGVYNVWHSDFVNKSGYNFSQYKNEDLDKNLDNFKTTTDEKVKSESIMNIQSILNENQPSIDLISQAYIYTTSQKLKTPIDEDSNLLIYPQDRFTTITDWRLKEKIILE